MSIGPRFVRKNHGAGHSYQLDGHKIPGVTTVLDAMAKPALVNWAANQAAEFAVNEWDRLSGLPVAARLREIATAHRSTTRKAAVRGTRIHTFAEQLVDGKDVHVPDELVGPVNAYARFLDRWEIESTLLEIPVCHTGYRYGGTLDGIVTSPKLGNPIIDVKTGTGVWPEVSLQLSGYGFCDLAIIDGREQPMPAWDGAYVAHVLPDDVELVPVVADETTWRVFVYLLSVYRWREAGKDEPVIGRAIQPEQINA